MADPGAIFGALADDTRRTVFVRVASERSGDRERARPRPAR